tara:strand:+ start:723 stop:1640 length:918 start_codon:yes stop_codon:yes gene_type:complete
MNKDEAIKEIKQLKELLDSGILTQDEYDVKSADLKKIILDSEKKKDEPSESKKEKEYWEQKAKEKPKTESTLKPTKAKQEKETVKPKVDAARNYIEKEKEIKISFKQFVIISSIVCFILCLIIPQNYEYNWGFPEAFGSFIAANIGTIIYLIAKRGKEKNKKIFLVLQYLPLMLASFGNYYDYSMGNDSFSKPTKAIESQAPKHHLPNYEQQGSRGAYIDKYNIDKYKFADSDYWYEIEENELDEFLNENYNVTPRDKRTREMLEELYIYTINGIKYEVRSSERMEFLKKYPNAIYKNSGWARKY